MKKHVLALLVTLATFSAAGANAQSAPLTTGPGYADTNNGILEVYIHAIMGDKALIQIKVPGTGMYSEKVTAPVGSLVNAGN